MLPAVVRNLVGRFTPHHAHAVVHALAAAEADFEPAAERVEPKEMPFWSPARLAMAHMLWGDGFTFPGGDLETERLARPLGASAATSVLVIGVGSGGPPAALARDMGTWVTGMESDPNLVVAARQFVAKAKLDKKVTIKEWDPANPGFSAKSHHHCLALDPRLGATPEPILDGIARAVRPGGQLVLTQLTCAAPLNMADPDVRRWAHLERRDVTEIQAGKAISRMLGRVGMDVRIAEDISNRHLEQALLGFRLLLRDLRESKPTRQQAVQLVAETELWLLRRRLMRGGQLRMMRWHAIRGLKTA